jgi:hypothetical protein
MFQALCALRVLEICSWYHTMCLVCWVWLLPMIFVHKLSSQLLGIITKLHSTCEEIESMSQEITSKLVCILNFDVRFP